MGRLFARALAVASLALSVASALGGCSSSNDGSARIDDQAATIGGPLYLVGSFDGSQGFGTWWKSLSLARELRRETRKDIHFTYFVNGAHFFQCSALEAASSECGAASTPDEIAARFAIAQQAIDDGHEIGNHSLFHKNGSTWTYSQWANDLKRMDAIVRGRLFEPIYDDGVPVFPRWDIRRAAPHELGATCSEDSECTSGMCAEIAEGTRFCTEACDRDRPCGDGFACGGTEWKDTFRWNDALITDVCMPMPSFPVVHGGQELFHADGTANTDLIDDSADHSRADRPLKPYKIVGFRAPYLAAAFGADGAPLWAALARDGYRYSSSQGGRVGREAVANFGGQKNLWEITVTGAYLGAPLAADSVYYAPPADQLDHGVRTSSGAISAETMRADYKQGIVERYGKRADGARVWGILSHFSPWQTDDGHSGSCGDIGWSGFHYRADCGESFWNVWADTIAWAARGCHDDDPGAVASPPLTSESRCPELEVRSYRDTLPALDGSR